MKSLSDTPFSYAGLRIYVSHPTPKVYIGQHWWLSDTLRAAMQARMTAMFGYQKGIVEQGKALVLKDKVILHPADAATLRKIA
jgi:hypothetical protein